MLSLCLTNQRIVGLKKEVYMTLRVDTTATRWDG